MNTIKLKGNNYGQKDPDPDARNRPCPQIAKAAVCPWNCAESGATPSIPFHKLTAQGDQILQHTHIEYKIG